MADDATGPPHGSDPYRGRLSVRHPDDDPSERQTFSREELREISAEAATRFPRAGTSEHLVLMEVNPTRLHAYWAVTSTSVEEARSRVGVTGAKAPMVLRTFAVDEQGTRRPRSAFDTEVQGLNSSSYVDVWSEARRYGAELGLLGDDGGFVGLVESAPVVLPSEPSLAADEPPPEPPTETTSIEASPAIAGDAGADWVLTPFSYPLVDETSSESVNPEHERVVEAAGEQARTEPESSEEGMPPAPSDDDPLALENVLTLSSHALGRGDVQLEVNAELRIFGRAKPGSDLHLFGRPVRLRPDGSFSITRPLPQGALVISTLLSGGFVEGDEE